MDARLEGQDKETSDHRHVLYTVLPKVLANHGWYVLHASVVAGPEGAVVFVGKSGAGKSTLAREFLDDRRFPFLLSDEMAILEFENGKFYTYSVVPELRFNSEVEDHRLKPCGIFRDKWVYRANSSYPSNPPRLDPPRIEAPLQKWPKKWPEKWPEKWPVANVILLTERENEGPKQRPHERQQPRIDNVLQLLLQSQFCADQSLSWSFGQLHESLSALGVNPLLLKLLASQQEKRELSWQIPWLTLNALIGRCQILTSRPFETLTRRAHSALTNQNGPF